jgi:xylulokinase
MEYLVGVDVGTSGCKVAVFDERHQLQASDQRGYALIAPRPGWIEFDPEAIWAALCGAVRGALAQLGTGLHRDAFCLGFSVFGEGLILADPSGRPVHRGILSSDVRSAAVAERMERDLDRATWYRRTGRLPHPMAVATKIIWARENLRGIVDGRTRFLDVGSWLFGRLGAGWVTDYSVASGTMLLDLDSLRWAPDLLAYAGIGLDSLPTPVQAGTRLGAPGAEAADSLGFPEAGQVRLVVGAMDQLCNAVGSGTVTPGDVVCSTGTVEAVTVVLDPTSVIEALMELNVPRLPSAIAGQFVTMMLLWNAGGSLRWFCDHFARKEKEEAEARGSDVYTALLRDEPKSRSVFFLPHLSGSGTPWMNPNSRGAFLGLTMAADVASLAHAIVEGLTFELKANLDAFVGSGARINDLVIVGGGSRSDRWLQLKADILQRTVSRLATEEAGCRGAAILAGCGCGLLDDPAAAARQWVQIGQTFSPSGEAGRYQRKYEVYRQIYRALESTNRAIVDLDAAI